MNNNPTSLPTEVEQATEKHLLKLVDNAFNECTESKTVPSTKWARQIIGMSDTLNSICNLLSQPKEQEAITQEPQQPVAYLLNKNMVTRCKSPGEKRLVELHREMGSTIEPLYTSPISGTAKEGGSYPDELVLQLMEGCKTVVEGYEMDGMEGMRNRDEVFYEWCNKAIQSFNKYKSKQDDTNGSGARTSI